MYCVNCGTLVSTKFCTKCGEEVQENNKSVVTLSNNERVIKNYHVTKVSTLFNWNKGNGHITITNKRIIYHAYGRKSKMISEVQLDKVNGIGTYFGNGMRIWMLIVGLIGLIIGWNLSDQGYSTDYTPLTFGIIFLIIMLYLGRQQMYYISVFAEGSNLSPISVSSGKTFKGLTGQGAAISVKGKATKEAIKMMEEIGGIVIDFKNMGDHAFDIWLSDESDSSIDEVSEDTEDGSENLFN